MNTYWRSIFGWSKSKVGTWETCKRDFYFTYIGRWEGPKGDPHRKRIQELSQLQPWRYVRGGLVHHAIETQLQHYRAGRPVTPSVAITQFERGLTEIQKKKDDKISEFHNGFPLPHTVFQNAMEVGLYELDNFFSEIWPNYERLEYLTHEEFDAFFVDGLRVLVKPDLVTQSEKYVVVTDWKTGKEYAPDEDRRQIRLYAWWAGEYYEMPLEEVRGEIVYLGSKKMKVEGCSEDDQALLREFMLNTAKEMLDVKSIEDLPPTPDSKVCKSCRFLLICPEGREELGLKE